MRSIISKISRTVRQRGVGNTLSIIFGQVADVFFDLRHGTDTVFWRSLPELEIDSPNKGRGNIYQATTTPALRRIFRDIRPLLPGRAGILDVGSGKGKVLMVAAEFGFDPVRGVEFSPELCGIARKNMVRYFKNRTDVPVIEIIERDAADYRIPHDENLFFFFNPFDASIFEIVIGNIARSLAEHPRQAFLIYNNPIHRAVIEGVAGFRVCRDYSIGGNQYLVFEYDL